MRDEKYKVVSDSLADSLNFQLSKEKFNANLYLFIAGDLINRGFDRLGAFFKSQHEEETQHSLMIFDLLTNLNVPVELLEINEVNFSINFIVDVGDKFVEAEIQTTQSLQEIKKQAEDEDCQMVVTKMLEMIANQIKEMEESFTFKDHADLCGNDWFKVMVWDMGA